MTVAPRRDAHSRTRRNLDGYYLAALEGRHYYTRASGKPDHYAAACAAASHASARGWTRDQLWQHFEELARLAARVDNRAPNSRRIAKFVNSAWDFAERPRTTSDPFTIKRALDAATEHLQRSKFTGRQHSLALVMDAALAQARRQRTLTPSLAVRSLELSTGLGKSTAARALQRLVELDFLAVVNLSNGENATKYRIRNTEPKVVVSGTLEVLPSGSEGLSHLGTASELAALDAFRALGRSAARVAAVLDELEGQSPTELAQRLGIATRTARAALRELEAAGLAYRQRRGRGFAWTVRLDVFTEETLTRVALDYGTHGTRERREATTAAQRERWHSWQQGRREATERSRLRRDERRLQLVAA